MHYDGVVLAYCRFGDGNMELQTTLFPAPWVKVPNFIFLLSGEVVQKSFPLMFL